MSNHVGADTLQQALQFGLEVLGSGGVLGGIVLLVRTKGDLRAALRKLDQDDKKNELDAARADRVQDSAES